MLHVVADVAIEFGAGRGRLIGDGRDLVLDVDDPSTLIGAVSPPTLRALAAGLTGAGLTLEVRSGERILLRAGRDVDTGLLSRVVRLPGVRLGTRFALRSALVRWRTRP